MKVMLIDDDDLVRSALVEVLEDAGFQVMDFADPREALGTFDAVGRPDVLVTDIDLRSTLNGFDVAAAAHRPCPTISVVLISGLPADHTGQLLDPRDQYLQKPISNCHLLQTIEQLTSRRERQHSVLARLPIVAKGRD
jgi:DNA-binding NtrC family response regulator